VFEPSRKVHHHEAEFAEPRGQASGANNNGRRGDGAASGVDHRCGVRVGCIRRVLDG